MSKNVVHCSKCSELFEWPQIALEHFKNYHSKNTQSYPLRNYNGPVVMEADSQDKFRCVQRKATGSIPFESENSESDNESARSQATIGPCACRCSQLRSSKRKIKRISYAEPDEESENEWPAIQPQSLGKKLTRERIKRIFHDRSSDSVESDDDWHPQVKPRLFLKKNTRLQEADSQDKFNHVLAADSQDKFRCVQRKATGSIPFESENSESDNESARSQATIGPCACRCSQLRSSKRKIKRISYAEPDEESENEWPAMQPQSLGKQLARKRVKRICHDRSSDSEESDDEWLQQRIVNSKSVRLNRKDDPSILQNHGQINLINLLFDCVVELERVSTDSIQHQHSVGKSPESKTPTQNALIKDSFIYHKPDENPPSDEPLDLSRKKHRSSDEIVGGLATVQYDCRRKKIIDNGDVDFISIISLSSTENSLIISDMSDDEIFPENLSLNISCTE